MIEIKGHEIRFNGETVGFVKANTTPTILEAFEWWTLDPARETREKLEEKLQEVETREDLWKADLQDARDEIERLEREIAELVEELEIARKGRP